MSKHRDFPTAGHKYAPTLSEAVKQDEDMQLLANVSAADKANARMTKAGRTRWNRADWNVAVREYDRLYPRTMNEAMGLGARWFREDVA